VIVKTKVGITALHRGVDVNNKVLSQLQLFKKEEQTLINLKEASIWEKLHPYKRKR